MAKTEEEKAAEAEAKAAETKKTEADKEAEAKADAEKKNTPDIHPDAPKPPADDDVDGDDKLAGRVVWSGRGTRLLTSGDLAMLGYEGPHNYEFVGGRTTAVPKKLQELLINDKRLVGFSHPS